MAQVHTLTPATSQKSVARKGLRHALRRWMECFLKNRPSSSHVPRTETPAPQIIPSADPPALPSQLGQANPPGLDGVALFKATTQTIIHSPLDKRNKASNASSPASTLRRSYLGSRRNTAPADYFSFGAKVSSGQQKDPWGALSSSETANPTGQVGPGHSRQSSRLRFPLSKRSSVHHSSRSASMAISPAPSAPSPSGYENEYCTRQAATTGEMVALVKAHPKLSVDVVEMGKKDTPNGSPSFERKKVGGVEIEEEEEEGKERGG